MQVIVPIIRAGNFEAGAQHIAELMELTLSGIDANDLPKTWATLSAHSPSRPPAYHALVALSLHRSGLGSVVSADGFRRLGRILHCPAFRNALDPDYVRCSRG